MAVPSVSLRLPSVHPSVTPICPPVRYSVRRSAPTVRPSVHDARLSGRLCRAQRPSACLPTRLPIRPSIRLSVPCRAVRSSRAVRLTVSSLVSVPPSQNFKQEQGVFQAVFRGCFRVFQGNFGVFRVLRGRPNH